MAYGGKRTADNCYGLLGLTGPIVCFFVVDEGRRLRSRVIQPNSEVANQVSYSCYLAQSEPKKVDEALQDEGWVSAMHDELHQFTRNYVWTLVPRPA
jgi:hypothetical protein